MVLSTAAQQKAMRIANELKVDKLSLSEALNDDAPEREAYLGLLEIFANEKLEVFTELIGGLPQAVDVMIKKEQKDRSVDSIDWDSLN